MGVLPILLPLMIVGLTHRLSWVAYVMGGYNLGLQTSPLWGSIADQRHAHRALFFGGFLVLMGALAAMPFLPEILPWTALPFLAGAGTAAVATVATLFVVEFNPQDEGSHASAGCKHLTVVVRWPGCCSLGYSAAISAWASFVLQRPYYRRSGWVPADCLWQQNVHADDQNWHPYAPRYGLAFTVYSGPRCRNSVPVPPWGCKQEIPKIPSRKIGPTTQ